MSEHEEIADSDSGLFSEAYLHSVLPTRVAAARRGLRPLGVAIVDVRPADLDPHVVAEVIKIPLRDSDTPCRLDAGRYALILEDTPLSGCRRAIERVRELLGEQVPDAKHWAGIACYPAHAFGEDELMAAAEKALQQARETADGALQMAETPED